MLKVIRAISVLGAVTLVAAAGKYAPADHFAFAADSRIWVEGTSSVRDYKCEAKRIDGAVTTRTVVLGIADLDTAVETVEFTIPVAQLDCDNGTMNGHMRKALKAETSPDIRYRLQGYTAAVADEQLAVTLNGELTIAGTTKPIEIPARVTRSASGAYRVEGSTTFKMTEWGVKPPSLMLGTMKVHDAVTVGFDVTLQQAN